MFEWWVFLCGCERMGYYYLCLSHLFGHYIYLFLCTWFLFLGILRFCVNNRLLLFLCWVRMEGVWHFLSYINLELVFFYSSTRSVEWLIPLRFILPNNNQIITAFHQSYFIQQYKETYTYNNILMLQCFSGFGLLYSFGVITRSCWK